MIKSSLIAISLSLFVCLSPSALGDWPNWLGPLHSGASAAGTPPSHWSRTEGVAWTGELGAPAVCPPIVWQDRVFIASRSESDGKVMLHALDKGTGRSRWNRELSSGRGVPAPLALLANGSQVFAFQSNGILKAFDLEGRELWNKSLFPLTKWSPSQCTVDGGKIFVQLPLVQPGQAEEIGACRVVALETRDGRQAWQRDFRRETGLQDAPSLSLVPTLHDGKHLLLITAFGRVHCLKQTDGQPVWATKPGEMTAGQPVKEMCLLGEGLLLVKPQDGNRVIAAAVSPAGGVSRLWESPFTGSLVHPHALLNGSGIFLFHQADAALVRLDSQTGQKKWSSRLPAGDWSQFPYLGGGNKIYGLRTDGDVAVLDALTGRVLTWNPMKTDERVPGSPGLALSLDQLFVSVGTRIHCIKGAVTGVRDAAKPVEGERIGEPPGLNRRRLPL